MIFIINAQGDIINTVPESVYQGSNNANTIVLAGPISPYTSVTAAFELPFNLTTTEMIMTPGGKFNGPEDLEEDWYYWTLSVPDTVTAYAGNVKVQFKCYNNSQQVNTANGGFIVQPGVAPELPPEPTDDIYQQILAALVLKQPIADSTLLPDVPTTTLTKTVPNAINYLYGQTEGLGEDKQDKTDSGLETTDKTVVGAINEVNEAAQEAVNTANEANTTAEAAEATANAAKQTADGVAGTANTALQNANNAVNTANQAQQTANQAQQTANDIAGTANEAKQIAQAAQTTAGQAVTTAQTAQTTANEAKSIAQGRAQAKVFDTVEDMNAWLAVPANTATLNVGDPIYIRAANSPDYWWDGTQALEMETDVDLTDVYTKEEADAKFVAQVPGKGLSSNDFTTAEKNKLAGLSNYTLPKAGSSILGGVKANLVTAAMTRPVGIDSNGYLYSEALPQAGPGVLGGVKPVAKTAEMTQDVGVDGTGKLYTAPGGADKASLIERASALPDTVGDDTADIWAIGGGTGTEFYFKNSPSTLSVTPDNLHDSETDTSDTSGSIVLTASGGTGEYTWTLNQTQTGDENDSVSITPNGNTCTVNYHVQTYINPSQGLGMNTDTLSGTIVCSSGGDSFTVNYEFDHTLTCLTGDTLITLYNGKRKRADEMKVGDEVLSFNPVSGLLEKDVVYYADSDKVKTYDHFDRYTFEDGTVIKVVHRHRFFNVDFHKMVHLDSWEIGERAFKQDGTTPALVKKEEGIMEEVRHYTIFTKNQNYFANGLLSGNRFTKPIVKG